MKTIMMAIRAFLATLKGTWKAVYKGGKVTMEWIRETANPAVWDFTCEAADATLRTGKQALHAIPNTLGRLTGGGKTGVAPAPAAEAAQPIQAQQESRQQQREAAKAEQTWQDLALATRAAARAMVRGEQPQGVPTSVVRWLTETLEPEERATLAGLPVEKVTAVLKGEEGHGVFPYVHAVQSRPNGPSQRREPVAPAPRPYVAAGGNPDPDDGLPTDPQQRALELRRRMAERAADRAARAAKRSPATDADRPRFGIGMRESGMTAALKARAQATEEALPRYGIGVRP